MPSAINPKVLMLDPAAEGPVPALGEAAEDPTAALGEIHGSCVEPVTTLSLCEHGESDGYQERGNGQT